MPSKNIPILKKAPDWISPLSEYVILWHGCTAIDKINIEKGGIKLKLCAVDADFGRGFYFYCIAPNRFGGKRLWFVLVMDDISVHAFKTFAFSVENRHRGPRRVCGPLLGWKTPLHNGRQEFLAANKLHRSINDTVELHDDTGTTSKTMGLGSVLRMASAQSKRHRQSTRSPALSSTPLFVKAAPLCARRRVGQIAFSPVRAGRLSQQGLLEPRAALPNQYQSSDSRSSTSPNRLVSDGVWAGRRLLETARCHE